MATIIGPNVREAQYGSGDNDGGFIGVYTYTGAAANGDTIVLGYLPGGLTVTDARLQFTDCGTSVTLDVGYSPVVSADGPTEDTDALFNDIDVATAAGTSRYDGAPIVLSRKTKLVAVVGGAAFTGSPTINVIINGKWDGEA